MTSCSNGTNNIFYYYFFIIRNVDDIRAPIPQTQGILVEPYQGRVIKFVIILCAVQDLVLMINKVDFDFELPSTLPHSAPRDTQRIDKGGRGGGGPMELHIENPKKYMSMKFYTQKNIGHQNFFP